MSGDVKNTFYAIGNNCLNVTMICYPVGADCAGLTLFALQFAVLRTNPPILPTAYIKPWRYLLMFDIDLFWDIQFSSRERPKLIFPLQGLGTDDRALIRIMVSRSEIDLFTIRKEFKETHDVSLHEFIQVETMIVSSSPCLLTLVWCVYCLIIRHLSVLLEFCVFVMSHCLCCCCTSFFCCCGEVVGYSFLRWLMSR